MLLQPSPSCSLSPTSCLSPKQLQLNSLPLEGALGGNVDKLAGFNLIPFDLSPFAPCKHMAQGYLRDDIPLIPSCPQGTGKIG